MHVATPLVCRISSCKVCSQQDYIPKAFNNCLRYCQRITLSYFSKGAIPDLIFQKMQYLMPLSLSPSVFGIIFLLIILISPIKCIEKIFFFVAVVNDMHDLQTVRGLHAPSNDVVLEDLSLPGLSELKGHWHGSLDASGGGNGDTLVKCFQCFVFLGVA